MYVATWNWATFNGDGQNNTRNPANLKELFIFCHNVGGRTFLFALAYIGGGLYDLTELVSEIVLASHGTAVDRNTGPNWGRGYGKNSQNHPFRTSVFVGKSK